MPGILSHPSSRRKVLLFGSQALSLDEKFARKLQSVLLSSPAFSWALEAIADLPQQWAQICTAVPSVQKIPGINLLEDLKCWSETGRFKQASFPLPNLILTPLVVITHLTQYTLFLEQHRAGNLDDHELHASFRDSAETLGLCTGLLSAAAVSSSADLEQLQHYASVAVRLAMIVGAVVDAHDASTDTDGAAKSFSVAWHNPEFGYEIARVLKSFPEV